MKIDCIKPYILVWTKKDALKEVISSVLGDEKFATLNASDHHEMFRFLEEYQPSIVVLDDELPQILGFEVYEVIKRIERFKDIKVILVSSAPKSTLSIDVCIERDQIQDLLLSKVRTFLPDEFGESESGTPIHEEAKRFARIIVSDIVLYNKDKAEKGAMDGTFHELLKREIEEGREFYSKRIPEMIHTTTNYFDEAIREFILKSSIM